MRSTNIALVLIASVLLTMIFQIKILQNALIGQQQIISDQQKLISNNIRTIDNNFKIILGLHTGEDNASN